MDIIEKKMHPYDRKAFYIFMCIAHGAIDRVSPLKRWIVRRKPERKRRMTINWAGVIIFSVDKKDPTLPVMPQNNADIATSSNPFVESFIVLPPLLLLYFIKSWNTSTLPERYEGSVSFTES